MSKTIIFHESIHFNLSRIIITILYVLFIKHVLNQTHTLNTSTEATETQLDFECENTLK